MTTGYRDQEIIIETGEITDVSTYMKNEVKMCEIDVKSDTIVNTISDEISEESESYKPKFYKNQPRMKRVHKALQLRKVTTMKKF